MKDGKSSLYVLFFIVLVDAIGFGIVLPLLPVFAIKFDLNNFHLGLLATGFAFAQLISAPLLGVLSDRLGRKKIITICLLGLAASYFLLSTAHSFTVALIARLISGFFTGNISVVYAMVSDLSSIKDREKSIGYVGAASGIGFVLGPVIGGLLAGNDNTAVDFKVVFGSAAIFTLLATLIAVFALKEGENKILSKFDLATRVRRTTVLIASNRTAMYLIYLSILMWFGFSAVYVYLSSWITINFSLGARDLSIVSTAFGMFVAFSQVFSYKVATQGKGILIGFQLAGVAMILMLAKPGAVLMVIIALMLGLGLGFLITNINSGLSFLGLKSQKGFIFGLSQSASNIGQSLGPLLIGIIYLYLDVSYVWIAIAISFFIGATLAVLYTVDNKKYTVTNEK